MATFCYFSNTLGCFLAVSSQLFRSTVDALKSSEKQSTTSTLAACPLFFAVLSGHQ